MAMQIPLFFMSKLCHLDKHIFLISESRKVHSINQLKKNHKPSKMTSEPEMQNATACAQNGRAAAQLGQFISALAGTWPEAPPLWMRREARKNTRRISA